MTKNTFAYDINENPIAISHNGFEYTMEYDNNGNNTKVFIGDTLFYENSYEGENIKSKMHGNGDTEAYEHDENKNVIATRKNNQLCYEWEYNEDGYKTYHKDYVQNKEYHYTYNESGNLIKVTDTDNYEIEYDNYSEASGGKITYRYRDDIKMKYALLDEDSATEDDESHENDSEKSAIMLINGGVYSTEKDDSDCKIEKIIYNDKEIVEIQSVFLNDNTETIEKIIYKDGTTLNYTYDKNGNVTEIYRNNELSERYEYDSIGQLIREDSLPLNKSIVFIYDHAGNIQEVEEYSYSLGELENPINKNSYRYKSSWKDKLTSYNNQEITYDEIGNPLHYRDDMELNLTSGKQLEGITWENKGVTYQYNADGVRTGKNVNGVETKYLLDGNAIIAEKTNDEIVWYSYDDNGILQGFEYQGNAYFYEKNVFGDICTIYDEHGVKKVTYTYDAWGNVVTIQGDQEIGNRNPFRYRGYYQDKESGFYYLNSRYYDGKTRRFLNTDEIIGANGGLLGYNLFAYCSNNPIKYVDLSGRVTLYEASIPLLYLL